MDKCGTMLSSYHRYDQDSSVESKELYMVNKILPGCIYQQPGTAQEGLCTDSSCRSNEFEYMRAKANFVYTFTGLQIIGIAFDGHAIYGPYNANEELWSCEDHDVCNGRFFPEMDNSYAYVATSTHPYILGCWGPGPNQSHP